MSPNEARLRALLKQEHEEARAYVKEIQQYLKNLDVCLYNINHLEKDVERVRS